MEHGALLERYGRRPGGARQLAVVLDDLLVVDLDGPRALRDFARLAWTVPREKILGVSETPRGYHVWLDVPGWNQKALNRWMAEWLGSWGWHGTSVDGLGRRGLLVDVRTGSNRYVVWPGSSALGDRRWVDLGEFARLIGRLRADVLPDWLVPGEASGKAPWVVDTVGDPWLAGWIAENQGGSGDISLEGLTFTGEDSELELTWAELERWLERLRGRAPGTGRNNLLNQVAYYSGTRCIAAGHSVESVRKKIIEVGESVGTHGVRATVDSGLNAGMQAIRSQTAQSQQKPGN
jgi:hypothetical protein